jgi:class 3 adenylate cyclase/tetratricopeptide (TPR) repeat protein
MHILVPQFIINKYSAGELSGEFQAVGMFVDISGFTAMTDGLMDHGQHGAEVLAEIMHKVFNPLVRCVYEQTGFIPTLAGDALTALFPFDSSFTDAHLRALAASWCIHQHMQVHKDYPTAYGTFKVSVKMGLSVGEVRWGIVTSADKSRATYYFQGSAIEGCTSAEKQAKAGEIVLDSGFTAQLGGSIKTASVGNYYSLLEVKASLPTSQDIEPYQHETEFITHFFPQVLSKQPYRGEFRQVVSMFISLPTVRTEEQLDIFMQSLFALQDQYGGLLNRLDFGDKGSHLLLFWGAPVTFENDIERALNFILDLQIQTSIPINAGITYRIAHAGYAGGEFREEYTTYGRGVNLAARFMAAAPRGEIWVDEYVARRVGSSFEIEFEKEQTFKGFTEKQSVYVLLERKEESEDFFQRTLIGRNAELSQLAEFVSPLWKGIYAGVSLIWGEAGIGKSHLMQAFQSSNLFSDNESYWALCQTDEVLRISLNPFRYWLKRYFGVNEHQVEARNKRNFNRRLDRLIDETPEPNLAEELDRTRSFLGALVDLHWSDSLYEQLDAQSRYENTLIGLAILLQAESLRQPVVIHLEDAQWLDEDSKTFLNRFIHTITAEANQSYPLAIIATARPEETEFLIDKEMISIEINLSEMNNGELAQLAEDLLEKSISTDLLALLGQRAEGNPFFAEQILRYLQDENLLLLDQDRWVVQSDALKKSPLPTDVRVLLVARLDQLTQEVKEVVQAASVLGHEFEIQLLTQMLQGDEMLPNKITLAEEASIWSAISQLRYLFKHALLRETAYRMQIRARRQLLHALAVEALERLYGNELRPHYGLLAYHCEQAGLEDKALQYLQLAGEAAAAGYANDEALDYFRRAMALVSEDQFEIRYNLLMAQEKTHDLQGEREKQRQDLAILVDLAKIYGDDQKIACVMQERGWLAFNTGDYDAAIADAQRIVHQLEDSQSLNSEMMRSLADGHELWGQALRLRGDAANSREQLETSLHLAQKTDYKSGEMKALEGLGALLWTQADYLAARDAYQQALIISQEIEDLRREWSILNHLGIIAKGLGEHAKAIEYYDQTLAIGRQIGDRLGESIALINLGNVSLAIGDYARARNYAILALPIIKEIDDRKDLGIVYANLGEVNYLIGDYVQAKEHAEKGLEVCREINFRMGEGIILGNLGQIAWSIGNYDLAKKFAEQSLTIAGEVGDRLGETTVLKNLGDALLKMNNLEEAENAYTQALEISASLDQVKEILQAKAGLASVALKENTPERISKAEDLVDEILPHLESSGKHQSRVSCPLEVYMICLHVLQASEDPRAITFLKDSYQELQARASRISDPDMRRSFLENVSVHVELERQYTQALEIDD